MHLRRRTFLAGAAVLGLDAMTGAPAGGSPASLPAIHEQVERGLTAAIGRYETLPLADTVRQLTTLEQLICKTVHAHRPSGRVSLDWMHLRARTLAVLAQAEVGLRRWDLAGRDASLASKLAEAAGDQPLTGRAIAVHGAAWSGRAQDGHAPHSAAQHLAGLGVHRGGRSALGAQACAWAAWTEAAARNRGGVHRALQHGAEILAGLPTAAWGPRAGTSLETYHPSDMALAGAQALLLVDDVEAAARPLAEAEGDITAADGAVYAGLRMTAAEYELRRRGGDPDRAAALAHDAIRLSRGRGKTWPELKTRRLAALARQRYGRDWSGLVATATV